MNDEIKEILNGLNVVIKHGGSVEINSKECKKIIDYITNLQEENKELKEEIQRQSKALCINDKLLVNYIEEVLNEK